MSEEKVAVLLETVSQTVLTTLKQMSSKQKVSLPLIGLDTLSLVLKVSMTDLMPVLEYLESKDQIVIHPNLSNSRRGTKKYSKVSLAGDVAATIVAAGLN